MLHSFDDHQTLPTAPARLPSPFENVPHPLGALAAEQLQSILRADSALEAALSTEGRMFAVLVVRTAAGDSQWLAGVSGVLPSMSSADLFVPPIPDPKRLEQVEAANQSALDKIEEQIEQALHAPHYLALIKEKAQKQRRFEDRLVYLSAQRELNRAERKCQRACKAGRS